MVTLGMAWKEDKTIYNNYSYFVVNTYVIYIGKRNKIDKYV